jgi:pimeloyl-ACP methyl ester carboxylesterase
MDAFDVIVPSLPGYGFSAAPATGGIDPDQIADLWVDLVAELGYQEFFAHGGDWGAAVTGSLATRHPDRLLGAHFTMFSPPIDPGTLSAEDKEWWDELQAYRDAEWGYVHLQRTKPQTPAFALTDSPVGLAAWILEKWCRWSDCVGENGERDPLLVFSAEELLTNVAIYWFTGSIGSSMRLYYESFGPGSSYGVPSRIEVPTGVSTFKDPNAPPRRLIEPWCDLRHYASTGYPSDRTMISGHDGVSAQGGRALPEVDGRVPVVVRYRRRLPRLPGVDPLAPGFRLPAVWDTRGLGSG